MAVAHHLLPRIIQSGLGVLAPSAGLAALACTLQQASGLAPQPLPAQVVVSPFDWTRLMAGAQHVFPLFSEFSCHSSAALPAGRPVQHSQQPLLAGPAAAGLGRARDILAEVLSIVHRMLGHTVDPAQVAVGPSFEHLG